LWITMSYMQQTDFYKQSTEIYDERISVVWFSFFIFNRKNRNQSIPVNHLNAQGNRLRETVVYKAARSVWLLFPEAYGSCLVYPCFGFCYLYVLLHNHPAGQ